MNMPYAECPKCGARYQGWALLYSRHQTCTSCGVKLKITVNGQTFEGYSPFDAERLIINLAPDKTKKKHQPKR